MKSVRLLGIGIAAGVVLDRIGLELRKPAADQFPWLRRRVNDTVNPWLLEHHIPGSEKAEIGTLEHVGRTSGLVRLTPVHPTLRGGTMLIPAPLGVGSQWVQNVLAAGRARIQLHETLYDLDRPELIPVGETGFFAPPIAGPFDRMGWRYLQLRVVASTPGAFPVHPATDAQIPIEPKMVVRQVEHETEAEAAPAPA
ncbi:MAG TPA: nitroreductase/quinone reductase family protein [Candidatus Limnocylindrales bacterium]|jgi:hypothetical protein